MFQYGALSIRPSDRFRQLARRSDGLRKYVRLQPVSNLPHGSPTPTMGGSLRNTAIDITGV
jgi:hypothetical protein